MIFGIAVAALGAAVRVARAVKADIDHYADARRALIDEHRDGHMAHLEIHSSNGDGRGGQ